MFLRRRRLLCRLGPLVRCPFVDSVHKAYYRFSCKSFSDHSSAHRQGYKFSKRFRCVPCHLRGCIRWAPSGTKIPSAVFPGLRHVLRVWEDRYGILCFLNRFLCYIWLLQVLFSYASGVPLHRVLYFFSLSAVVVWTFIILVVNELIKLRSIRSFAREQRRTKLGFDTKLGMNSPYWQKVVLGVVSVLSILDRFAFWVPCHILSSLWWVNYAISVFFL